MTLIAQPQIDPTKLDTKRTALIHGLKVTGNVSAFDIPQGIRVTLDDTRTKLRLRILYLDGEEMVTRATSEQISVSFHLGRNSRRLIEIDVDLSKFEPNETLPAILSGRVTTSIGALRASPSFKWTPAEIKQLGIVEEAISDYSEQLFGPLLEHI